MQKERLNIIIPIYNPHAGWNEFFVEAVKQLEMELADTQLSVILVNDGSTREIKELPGVLESSKIIRYHSLEKNQGKGFAVRYGVGMEEADYYCYTDVDFPFGYEPIVLSYKQLKASGKNLVFGIRERSYYKMLPAEREFISYLLKWFSMIITGFKLRDTQAPMKTMDNRARQILLSTKTDGFIFDFEFLLHCLGKKISFSTINIAPRRKITFTDFRLTFLRKQFIDVIKVFFR